MTIFKQIFSKSKNRRVLITLIEEEGEFYFKINTKRLISGREIHTSIETYTPETFSIIRDLMPYMIDDDVIRIIEFKPSDLDVTVYTKPI
jgi:hypothetical protein